MALWLAATGPSRRFSNFPAGHRCVRSVYGSTAGSAVGWWRWRWRWRWWWWWWWGWQGRPALQLETSDEVCKLDASASGPDP